MSLYLETKRRDGSVALRQRPLFKFKISFLISLRVWPDHYDSKHVCKIKVVFINSTLCKWHRTTVAKFVLEKQSDKSSFPVSVAGCR